MPQSKAERIRQIRGHFEAMGFDTSSLSDEDIERGCVEIAAAVRRFGLTTAEAARRLQAIGRIITPPPSRFTPGATEATKVP